MPLYERDDKGALVPVAGEIPEEAIMAIERADEQTIVERLTRIEAQPFFAYSYPIRTKEGIKEIIGISVDGAKEIARQLGNIRASTDIKLEEKDDYFYVLVPVTDLVRNVTLLGVGRQSKYIIGEGMIPSDRIDETAFVKAISKAQRNGILSVAPQLAIADIISRLDPKAIKRLPGPPASGKPYLSPSKALAKPKPGETVSPELAEIASLRQKLHLKWDELQKADPSVGDKKEWLKEHYKAESSIELSLEQLKEAIQNVGAEITLSAGPVATTEEKREIVKALRELGKNDKEITSFFHEITGKKGGWTKADIEKLSAKIAELKPKTEGEKTPEAEVEDLFKSLES